MFLLAIVTFLSVFVSPVNSENSDTTQSPLTPPLKLSGLEYKTAHEEGEALNFDYPIDHYDLGYPESRDGKLVLRPSPDGPVVPLSEAGTGLLYAQFVNEQRDAVYLARTGDFSDTLPDGREVLIPFGFGALKLNEVFVSLVEGEKIPHFSDNGKKYTLFPLQDFYLGSSLGLSGLTFNFRYVLKERYTGHLALGVNALGPLFQKGVYGSYIVPFHVGGGYRFPGILPDLIGPNNITLGMDLLTGFGDRDQREESPAFFCLPGIFLDFERLFFRGVPDRQDFRQKSEPYNYGVNALFVRLGMYLNTSGGDYSGLFLFDLSFGFLFNIKGPAIPAHKFKETKPVYMHRLYIEDLEQQKKRSETRQETSYPVEK
jgi:hypothetical protein